MYALQTNQYQSREPQWHPHTQFVGGALPHSVARWLLDTGSLTAHLRRKSQGQFRVQVLSQRWGLPRPSERRLLGMREREWGLVREVLLCCHEQPWVFARSVLPARSLVGHLRQLRRLDSRPLGHLLFTDPTMERVPYEICRIEGAAIPVTGLVDDEVTMWGRRSCFLLAGRPIMVSEIFLPDFQAW